MRRLNIRRWSTPLIIGTGIFVATTGVLMFLTTTDLVRFAHEIIGVGFAIAIVLHILSNWVPFKRYFAQRAVIIIVLAWGIGIGLVTATVLQPTEDAEEVVVERIEQTPIRLLAPVVGKGVRELVLHLRVAGFPVETPEMTVEHLAEKHNTDTEAILLLVFH
ncbi:MAG: DUF4405 domain-containing protein [Candidatus Poribacteria bacterium]|nr:DUF4405 domain-containing protein [Candidatus Poribacteria bacterium]